MSAPGTVVLIWAHGEDTFCLAKIGQILDLEERCGSGIAAIVQRLENHTWGIRDVREPIRLGLIGGGMDPERAQEIVERHVVPPFVAHLKTAHTILASAMVMPFGDQPGKDAADRQAPESGSL